MRHTCLLLALVTTAAPGCFTGAVVDASMDEPVALMLLPMAMAADAVVLAASADASVETHDYDEGGDYESYDSSQSCSGPWSCAENHSRICETRADECACHCQRNR